MERRVWAACRRSGWTRSPVACCTHGVGVSCGQGLRELVLKEGVRGSEGRCRVGEGAGPLRSPGAGPYTCSRLGRLPLCFLYPVCLLCVPTTVTLTTLLTPDVWAFFHTGQFSATPAPCPNPILMLTGISDDPIGLGLSPGRLPLTLDANCRQ